MAKVVSPVWSIIRGSIAGTTYSANQYAQIVAKKKIASAQLPSGNQTLLQQAFAMAAFSWQNLTEANRLSWANYALTVPFTKATGTYTVSGRSLFIGTRAFVNYLNARFAAGLTLVDVAPSQVGRYALLSVTTAPRTTAGDGFKMLVSNGANRTLTYQLDIAGPFTQSRNKWNGPWDGSKSASGGITIINPNTIVVNTGSPGMYFFWRLRCVTNDLLPLPGNALTMVWTGRQIANHV